RGVDHVNGVPRAPALAQRATNAALQIDVAERLQSGLILPRNLVDAIDRAYFNTCLAPSAIVRSDDGEFLGKFLSRLARTFRHDRFLVPECPDGLKSVLP